MSGDLAAWLHDPALEPVWRAARERLERNGVQPQGSVTVRGLDRVGRHAVSGLVGRPVLRESVRVDLESVDAALRERSGAGGLVAVLEVLGDPVRNRAADRSSSATRREAPYVAARAWLSDHPEVAGRHWVEEWLAGLRRSGVLTRLSDGQLAADALVRSLEISSELTGSGATTVMSRNELAARTTGDAHALDEGGVLGQIVVRALAAAAGQTVPVTVSGRRQLWEQYGVTPDLVSSTALVLGLRPSGVSSVARRLTLAAEAGDPVHLTAWDMGRDPLELGPGMWVLVCENPRVLEALAQARGGAVPAVCTSGMPGLVTLELLRQLSCSGAELAYHGDFDWPGLAIANRLVSLVGARPWHMSAADYLAAVRADGPALEGTPVVATWDPSLGEAMAEHGVAVHEEALLRGLLMML